MSVLVIGNVIPEYWRVFIIRYILNGAEGAIRLYMILKVNITCGKVKEQRDVTGIIRAITKKYAMPGLWLSMKSILTIS